jgi:hypothetical protein
MAVRPLFSTLDALETRLASHRDICGDRLTEACNRESLQLFTTLLVSSHQIVEMDQLPLVASDPAASCVAFWVGDPQCAAFKRL